MFENLKKSLQERIEKDAVKIPNLSYKDKNGNVKTEDIVLKRSKLPLVGDWSRVYPPVNEDGSWNLVNFIFGGKKNLKKLILMLVVVGMVLLAFKDIFGQYSSLREICKPLVENINP